MGWQINPQENSDMNLTQSVVPLKKVITFFIDSLEKHCESVGKNHKLEGVDLYKVFRTLQSRSHTSRMVQNVALGKRGGKVLITVNYGSIGSQYSPILTFNKVPTKVMLDNLRNTISDFKGATVLKPYDVSILYKDETE